jgi:MinD superfamily P-loop ATPase
MEINEIVVISGKGGTGKTTLTSSFVPYFQDLLVADCDVDAPDLHILFDREIKEETDFVGLKKARLDKSKCIDCKICYESCKFDAISESVEINSTKCEGCGVCEYVCPVDAVSMEDAVVGKLFTSDTAYGEMVHARLIPGEETSGKLVSEVRKKAKKIALENGKKYILVDGSPGLACNVISSITGAKKVVIVVEPTFSGLHDLKRVYQLTQNFRLPVYVVVNKYNISKEKTGEIQKYCNENGIELALKIPFDKSMVEAIVEKQIPSIYNRELFESIGFEAFVEKLKTI